jgi:uncharacterized protein with ParB-like and HNH nuclease domain
VQEIQGKAKTIRVLLTEKYAVDYYQREYKWETKQIQELIDDLSIRFLTDYRPEHSPEMVDNYNRYFLGSIIISKKAGKSFIVDGQQRLTSLTLLLIFLRNRQLLYDQECDVQSLIASKKHRLLTFNLDVPERNPALEALYAGKSFDQTGQPESIQAILARYQDIEDSFPQEIDEHALPTFVEWLVDNVDLIEITAYSDDDAYTIFETMNDRGLSLTPTEMLKGYLLANIRDDKRKNVASDFWKQRTQELRDAGKENESDFFKTWLRSQYAEKIRERKKGAKAEDFDRIGTEFHRWVREHASDRDNDLLTLTDTEQFFQFIRRDFDFYSRHYLRLMTASKQAEPGLEHVLYNAWMGFTLQYMLLLAPLHPGDSDVVAKTKIRLVAMFIDTLLVWRVWNFRSIAYSTMQYAMFLVMRDIRGLAPEPLAQKLHSVLLKESETFATNDRLYLHQQNRWLLHLLLARLTDYVEQQAGMPSHYLEYVGGSGKARYEVEHIWADKPEEHTDEFAHVADFADHRNRFGGLLLLPKSFNASYGALPYSEKLKHYNAQNLLARSLHPECYDHNPGFLAFVKESNLPFAPTEQFGKADFEERRQLMQRIAERIWNPEQLLREVGL